MRRIGDHFLHDVLDFGQLVHEINLVMKASGSVDEYDVRIVRFGGLECVVRN